MQRTTISKAGRPPVKQASERRIFALTGWDSTFNRLLTRGMMDFIVKRPNWVLRTGPPTLAAKHLLDWQPDGVILTGEAQRAARRLHQSGIPMVGVLGFSAKCPVALAVENDDIAIGQAAAAYLLNRGFNQFGLVGGLEAAWSRRREMGFRRGLAAAGFEPMVHPVTPQATRNLWEHNLPNPDVSLRSWVVSLPKPIAIFAVQDVWGREVAEACHSAGVPVPEQVAVIGADDDDMWCEMSQPPLSSVDVRFRRVGFEAVRWLDRLLRGEEPPPEPVLIPPGEVVTRRSSDVFAVRDRDVAAVLRYIAEHAREPITVADVLQRTPVDRRRLEREFRRLLGRTPLQEIRRVRMNYAKQLLSRTDLAMSEIADRCGSIRFNSVFKKETGLTPTEWRRRSRSPSE